MEGTSGVNFGFVDLNNDPPAFCAPRIGWLTNPTVDYRSDDFLIDAFQVSVSIRRKELPELLEECNDNEDCIGTIAKVAWPAAAMIGATVALMELGEAIVPPAPFRAKARPGEPPVVKGVPFEGEERKYHLNVPAGYSICSIHLKTLGVTPPTGRAALLDMTFSESEAAMYIHSRRVNDIFGGGTGFDGKFSVAYVKSPRAEHYRSLGLCNVGPQPQNFLCRGNGTGSIVQDDGRGRSFDFCGDHDLAEDAQY